MNKHDGLAGQLAETIATMVQALRMGETSRARQLGVTALAIYAHDREISVDDLLAAADPGGGLNIGSGERPRVERDAPVPQDPLEVLDPTHRPARSLMGASRFVSGLRQLVS